MARAKQEPEDRGRTENFEKEKRRSKGGEERQQREDKEYTKQIEEEKKKAKK